eukprot:jgi/Chrzof1/13817/Cz08g13150.t1
MSTEGPVLSEPYPWPYNGALRPDNTAFIVIDMQTDFCGKGGYVDMMGYDLSLTRAPIEPIKRVLSACRAAGHLVIHTREGHRPELVDLPANKRWRSSKIGAGIGEPGPAGRLLVRGEPGWDIIPECAPVEGEIIIDKPGKGSFYATDLELILHTKGISNLVLAGVTTDVCVHTTMRVANDMGFECLILSDATAATDPKNHLAALDMVKKQGGVFGAVATADAFIAVITHSAKPSVNGTTAAPNGAAAANGAGMDKVVTVKAAPYDYSLPVAHTALVMIDFQKDFMAEGVGFGAALGNDVTLLRECLPGAQQLLASCRAAGMPIVHTMEAHKPDLSDLHPAKLARGNLPPGLRIGDEGELGRILIRGEPGNGIVDEVAPLENEKLLYKPGKGSFYATDLEQWLHDRNITHLIFAGVTTEVCVQTSMREANDRGFECLLVSDATGSYFPEFKAVTLKMISSQGGIVGWVACSDDVAAALQAVK